MQKCWWISVGEVRAQKKAAPRVSAASCNRDKLAERYLLIKKSKPLHAQPRLSDAGAAHIMARMWFRDTEREVGAPLFVPPLIDIFFSIYLCSFVRCFFSSVLSFILITSRWWMRNSLWNYQAPQKPASWQMSRDESAPEPNRLEWLQPVLQAQLCVCGIFVIWCCCPRSKRRFLLLCLIKYMPIGEKRG